MAQSSKDLRPGFAYAFVGVCASIVLLGVGLKILLPSTRSEAPESYIAPTLRDAPAPVVVERVSEPQPFVAIDVRAIDLDAAYDANEVAADMKYKGRVLRVTGKVASIGKNFMDEVVVNLGTRNQFQSVTAGVDASAIDRAATLRKGQLITLVCVGAGRVVSSAVLSGCQIEDVQDAKPRRDYDAELRRSLRKQNLSILK